MIELECAGVQLPSEYTIPYSVLSASIASPNICGYQPALGVLALQNPQCSILPLKATTICTNESKSPPSYASHSLQCIYRPPNYRASHKTPLLKNTPELCTIDQNPSDITERTEQIRVPGVRAAESVEGQARRRWLCLCA